MPRQPRQCPVRVQRCADLLISVGPWTKALDPTWAHRPRGTGVGSPGKSWEVMGSHGFFSDVHGLQRVRDGRMRSDRSASASESLIL